MWGAGRCEATDSYTVYNLLWIVWSGICMETDDVTLLGYSQLKLRTGICLATVVPMVNINHLMRIREMLGNGMFDYGVLITFGWENYYVLPIDYELEFLS